ncbi:MAG: PAS domain S-box protein [Deltaproteobacteria bacterium]|nr:PAS domain S-box protein [Deltaproteobacteria bacterium]
MKNLESSKNGASLPDGRGNISSKRDASISENLLLACDKVSSERYQAFVENIEEGVYEVDIQGNFLYFNSSLCKVFGYTKEEIQFQNFSKFMSAEYSNIALETFKKIYRTGQPVSDVIWEFIDKKGEQRIVELSANLITDSGGKIIGFRGIVRDITNRFKIQRALQESEKRYKTLLDFVPHPIVVFSMDGRVSYLNPAFTEIFGWTLEELEGEKIPYIPPGLEQETCENIRKLFQEKIILRQETQRLTKDGRILEVAFRAAVFSETEDEPSGELVLLRDITHQKRIERNNEALLQTSMALPEYPDLDDLLRYISTKIKNLINAEGALVILLDEEKNELFFKSAAHDNQAAEKRLKEVRFPATKGISGKVIRTGESIIVKDTSVDPDFYPVVDIQAGFTTRSLLDVPLRSGERIIGVLCVMNKKHGAFDETDIELLNTISGTVALSIENARVSKEIKDAYQEVASLNRAKDRVINHLSHELRTPLAVLTATLSILGKKLALLPPDTYRPTIDRAQRNLNRILEMQYQVEDIMREQHYDAHHLLSLLLDECSDELEVLVADEVGEGRIVDKIRNRINEIFLPKENPPREILLKQFIETALEEIRPRFSHRKIDLELHLESTRPIFMPEDSLRKVVVGLVKNGIENTPDGGKIEIHCREKGNGVELVVRDYGVGITLENRRRIFEGFFVTQETMDYSTKREFDFNAGGKGADLLRMKIFSERYHFKIDMVSSRCQYIPLDEDICPGDISKCSFCKEKRDCFLSGGTTFTVFFPFSENPAASVG